MSLVLRRLARLASLSIFSIPVRPAPRVLQLTPTARSATRLPVLLAPTDIFWKPPANLAMKDSQDVNFVMLPLALPVPQDTF